MDHLIKHLRRLTMKSNKEKQPYQNFDTLPLEIFNKILSLLTVQEKLNCRLLSSSFMTRIDALFQHKAILRLCDKSYKNEKTPAQWNIAPSALLIQERLLKKISNRFIINYTSYVKVVEISSTISSKNFHKLVTELPLLQILTLNSLALGGETIFLAPTFPSTILDKKQCSFRQLHLKLEYVPSSEGCFSTQTLINNLLGMHGWNAPYIKEICIEVKGSTFSEQFYFTYDLLLLSIPRIAYDVLEKLEIVSPRMRPFHSVTSSLREEISKLQLKTLTITSSSSQATFSPAVISFIQNQIKLKYLIIRIQAPLRNIIINELRKVNPNVVVEYIE